MIFCIRRSARSTIANGAFLAGSVVKIVGDYAWEQGQQRFGIKESLDDFIKNTKTMNKNISKTKTNKSMNKNKTKKLRNL